MVYLRRAYPTKESHYFSANLVEFNRSVKWSDVFNNKNFSEFPSLMILPPESKVNNDFKNSAKFKMDCPLCGRVTAVDFSAVVKFSLLERGNVDVDDFEGWREALDFFDFEDAPGS